MNYGTGNIPRLNCTMINQHAVEGKNNIEMWRENDNRESPTVGGTSRTDTKSVHELLFQYYLRFIILYSSGLQQR